MPQVPTYAYVIAAAVLFFLLGWIAFRIRNEKLHGQAGQMRQKLLEDARKEASDLLKTAKLESKEEFYQARSKRMAERAAKGRKMRNAANAPSFEDIDLDGDGKVSAKEFSAHQTEEMAKHRRKKQNRSDN